MIADDNLTLAQAQENLRNLRGKLDVAMEGIAALQKTVGAMRETPVTHNQREGQIQLVQDMLTKLKREIDTYGELPF